MGVYLYPSGTETELKNAYIGGYYEYSYDFRNKTTANLTADGWTLYSGGSYINSDSNGMWCKTNGQSSNVLRSIGGVLSNAKKVVLTYNVYVNKAATTGDSGAMRICNSDRSNASGPTIGAQSATGPQGYAINFLSNTYGRQNVNMTQGVHSIKLVIDLENKNMTQTITGYTTITQTLTDAQITTFKSLQYVCLTMFANANVPVYKSQSFNLEIEY